VLNLTRFMSTQYPSFYIKLTQDKDMLESNINIG